MYVASVTIISKKKVVVESIELKEVIEEVFEDANVVLEENGDFELTSTKAISNTVIKAIFKSKKKKAILLIHRINKTKKSHNALDNNVAVEVYKEAQEGKKASEICKEYKISQATFYRIKGAQGKYKFLKNL
jgi:Mor family transcriptional regulator